MNQVSEISPPDWLNCVFAVKTIMMEMAPRLSLKNIVQLALTNSLLYKLYLKQSKSVELWTGTKNGVGVLDIGQKVKETFGWSFKGYHYRKALKRIRQNRVASPLGHHLKRLWCIGGCGRSFGPNDIQYLPDDFGYTNDNLVPHIVVTRCCFAQCMGCIRLKSDWYVEPAWSARVTAIAEEEILQELDNRNLQLEPKERCNLVSRVIEDILTLFCYPWMREYPPIKGIWYTFNSHFRPAMSTARYWEPSFSASMREKSRSALKNHLYREGLLRKRLRRSCQNKKDTKSL